MSYLVKYLEWLSTQDKNEIFKTTMGRFRTQSLFLELNKTDAEKPFLTTKTRHYVVDGREYWSLPLLYLELGDVTEYQVGELLFYNHEHWCRLIQTKGFKPTINKLRDELELKLRAEALATIKDIAKNGPPASALGAAKLILDRGWMSKSEQKTKQAQKRNEKFKESVETELDEDYKLIEVLNEQTSAN